MSVHQLAREALSVGSHRVQAFFINGSGTLGRYQDIKPQCTPEGPPEGEGLPVGQDERKSDRDILPAVHLTEGVFPQQEGLADLEEIRSSFLFLRCAKGSSCIPLRPPLRDGLLDARGSRGRVFDSGCYPVCG